MVKLLAERAPAKINLFLRVTGRRADGYHELDSIFVPVSIADRITVELRPAAASSVTLRCDLAALGDPEANLAVRAARAFMTEFGACAQVLVGLEKSIPVGAGLGGGSSDAGAVLRMMARMYRIEGRARLLKIAAALGADVPFFLDPRPARVTGIGEIISPLVGFPPLHLVIAVAPVEVSTAAIFKALRRDCFSGGVAQTDLAEIARGEIAPRHLVNDLTAAAIERYPEIAELKVILEEVGARGAAMSGSGGAVFGLFADYAQALRAADEVRSKAPEARVFAAKSL